MGLEWPVRLDTIDTYRLGVHGVFRWLELEELQVLDRYASALVNEIEEAWPVDTSTSRDAFSYTILNDGTTGFTILNDCDYVEFIVQPGDHNVDNGGTPVMDIIIPQVLSKSNQTVSDMLDAMRTVTDTVERRLAATPAPARKPRGKR